MKILKSMAVGGCMVFGSGCATKLPYFAVDNLNSTQKASLEACKVFFQSLDQVVEKAGVRDTMYHRLKGFPFLRVNRFLASYRHVPMNARYFDAWLDRMQALDIQARYYEILNLAGRHNVRGIENYQDTQSVYETARNCSDILRRALPNTPEIVRMIRSRARVPDSYQSWKRWLGLYPISAQMVKMGIGNYHREVKKSYQKPLGQLPSVGLLRRISPNGATTLTPGKIKHLFNAAMRNPLSIPEFDDDQLKSLFEHFAPVLEIDTGGNHDRIGRIYLNGSEKPRIDAAKPLVYTFPSYTLYRGNAMLQLNYAFWFPQRPFQKRWDLLSGVLDGIIWRVTLSPDGEPFMYDSIHQCGCYHKYFPTHGIALKSKSGQLPEPPLVPQIAPKPTAGKRMVLRISSQSHYIQRLYTDRIKSDNKFHYNLTDYDIMRSLPTASGLRRSLFDRHNMVRGSERLERFLFWPMGIRSPGAMRQIGHHAVAFVGRRHFDDANLFEELFETVNSHR